MNLSKTVPFIKIARFFKHNYSPAVIEGHVQKRIADAMEGHRNMGAMVKYVGIGMMCLLIFFGLYLFVSLALPKMIEIGATGTVNAVNSGVVGQIVG